MSLFSGRKPLHIGVREGRLASCPATPNCVSSQSDRKSAFTPPFPLKGTPEESWQKFITALSAVSGARLIVNQYPYLHAECVTRIMGFTDDLEALLNEDEGVIHVRSASRLGYSDFGKNRARIDALRHHYQSQD